MCEEEPARDVMGVETGIRVLVVHAVVTGPVVDGALVGACVVEEVPELQSMRKKRRGALAW